MGWIDGGNIRIEYRFGAGHTERYRDYAAELMSLGPDVILVSSGSAWPLDYARWLGEEPDPHDLMKPFPAELMRMWPISTRVNKPENDDPSIIEPIELATDAA